MKKMGEKVGVSIRDLATLENKSDVNTITGTIGQKTSSKEMEDIWLKLNQMLKQTEKEQSKTYELL